MTSSAYPALFAPLELRGFTLRNRIAHASIVTRYVRDGRATETLLNYYRSRAAGGAALIVTEPLAMTEHNRIPSRLRAWDDAAFDSLAMAAEVVNREGALLLGQVQDSGRARHSVGRNDQAIGASALPDDLSWTVPAVLSADAIRRMVDDWAEGSQRLQRAGFAGVEISAGHGHLFHQFLSPWSNRREDAYGVDLEGRTRLLRELIEAIRDRCGARFIIGLKLPADDGVPGSVGLPAAHAIAERLASLAHAFDYWTWVWGTHARSLYRHLPDAHGPRHPYLGDIRALRAHAPAIASGAIGYLTDPSECEAALVDGTADLVFLGRPLITDPAFPAKAQAGRAGEIRYCVSCNSCWRSIIDGDALQCDNNPRVAEPDEHDWRLARAAAPRRVIVVGSGIAALEAAQTAARRGHEVWVLGRSSEVGGKTRLHARLPGGENLSSIYDYQWLAGRKAGVRYRLGEDVRLHDVLALEPDVVLLAAGSTSSIPDWIDDAWREPGLVPGIRELAPDLLERADRTPGRAVLVDQDHTEMTYAVAELLARRFATVSLVTSRERFAHDVALVTRQGIYQRLHDLGVEMIPCVEPRHLAGLEEGRLDLFNVYTGRSTQLCDVVCVTHASPRVPNDDWLVPLREAGLEVIAIGDCRAPRSVMATTREAYRTALAL